MLSLNIVIHAKKVGLGGGCCVLVAHKILVTSQKSRALSFNFFKFAFLGKFLPYDRIVSEGLWEKDRPFDRFTDLQVIFCIFIFLDPDIFWGNIVFGD